MPKRPPRREPPLRHLTSVPTGDAAAPPPPSPSALPSGAAPAPSSGGSRRRRDRHGRGPRGPLVPAALPGARTRAERFDDVVLDAVEHLERRWREQLAQIEFAVEDVPPAGSSGWGRAEVALGRFFPAGRGLRPRVVLYRRPLETRSVDDADLAELVHDVVVEQVASALAMPPEQVDPHYHDD